MKTKYYLVRVQLPDDIPVNYMAYYIRAAIRNWKGSMDPREALFNMDARQFSVKTVGIVKGKPVSHKGRQRTLPDEHEIGGGNECKEEGGNG